MRKTELLQAQVSEKNREESQEIRVHEEIKNTPFTAVYIEDKWVIVMGDEIASGEKFNNVEEAREYIDNKPWELIVTAGLIFSNIIKKKKNEK